MNYIPYKPPQPEYADTLFAFQAFYAPNVGAVIEPDPLGPVNKIVTLTVGDRRIKSALCPVDAGTVVTVGRKPGTPLIRYWGPDWSQLSNPPGGFPESLPYRQPGWYLEVDGRRVIDVTDHELRPPPEPPRPPWYRRARRALTGAARQQVRADLDAIARRLGYCRDEREYW